MSPDESLARRPLSPTKVDLSCCIRVLGRDELYPEAAYPSQIGTQGSRDVGCASRIVKTIDFIELSRRNGLWILEQTGLAQPEQFEGRLRSRVCRFHVPKPVSPSELIAVFANLADRTGQH